MAELTLQQLNEKMTAVNADINKAEGERKVVWGDLSKEFGVKTIDEAYDQLDKLDAELEVKKEERQTLMVSTQKRLAEYGY